MSESKPVAEMTSDELEALLKERKKAERAAQEKRERDYVKKRDEFVTGTVRLFKQLHNRLKDFKVEILADGNALHKELYEVFEKQEKDLKQFSLVTEDGKYRVELQRAERQGFDESAEVAINQIKDILRDKFENRNKTMYKIINEILSSNKAGDYDPRLVSKLRKHETDIDDVRFSEALDILSNSYKTESTALYARAYERENPDASWKDITLQFSKL